MQPMIFLDGFLTGLILQIAIGPVFFYILNLTLQRSLIDGYLAILAAVLVDYMYITLAILGVGKFLEQGKYKRLLGIISSIVLVIFGVLMVLSAGEGQFAVDGHPWSRELFLQFLVHAAADDLKSANDHFLDQPFCQQGGRKGIFKTRIDPLRFCSRPGHICFSGTDGYRDILSESSNIFSVDPDTQSGRRGCSDALRPGPPGGTAPG